MPEQGNLALWSNGTDFVVASDRDDAVRLAAETHGYPTVEGFMAEANASPFDKLPEDKIHRLVVEREDGEGETEIRAYPHYFVQRFGRRYLGSTEALRRRWRRR